MAFQKLGNSLQGSLKSLQDIVSHKLGGKHDHKHRDDQVNRVVKDIERTLVTADIDAKIVRGLSVSLRKQIQASFAACDKDGFQHKNTARFIQECLFRELVKLVSPVPTATAAATQDADACATARTTEIIMLVGLQGSGKTTSIAKLAYYYKRQMRKVALVGADTFRAGAHEQLKQNAVKVGVPFYGNPRELDPAIVAAAGCDLFRREKYEVILVDTSGRHMQSDALFEEMKQVAAAIEPTTTLFVLDALNGQSARDHAAAFARAVRVGGIILTKMDGAAKGGGALAAIASTGARVLFVGMGEHMDQLEPFEPAGFIGRLLGLGDMNALMRKFAEAHTMMSAGGAAGSADSGMEMLQFLQSGKPMTLRHFYTQMQLMNNLGSLQGLLDMAGINMSALMMRADSNVDAAADLNQGESKSKKAKSRSPPQQQQQPMNPEQLTKSFKLWRCALDSASNAELEMTMCDWRGMSAPDRAARIARIARGSGTSTEQFQRLLSVFEQLSTMFQKSGKALSKLGPGAGGAHGASGAGFDLGSLGSLVADMMSGGHGGHGGRGGRGGARAPNLSSLLGSLGQTGGGRGRGAALSEMMRKLSSMSH